MVSVRMHKHGMRAVAKLVFATLSFLFLASFLAWPCVHGGDLLVSLASVSGATRAAVPGIARMTAAPLMTTLPPLTRAPETPASALSEPYSRSTAKSPTLPVSPYAFVARSAQAQSVPAFSRITGSTSRSWAPMAMGGEYCAEHKLFKPRTSTVDTFDELPVPDRVLRIIAILAVALILSSVPRTRERRPARPRPGWVRALSLPFATADPPRLAYFAAMRDA